MKSWRGEMYCRWISWCLKIVLRSSFSSSFPWDPCWREQLRRLGSIASWRASSTLSSSKFVLSIDSRMLQCPPPAVARSWTICLLQSWPIPKVCMQILGSCSTSFETSLSFLRSMSPSVMIKILLSRFSEGVGSFWSNMTYRGFIMFLFSLFP